MNNRSLSSAKLLLAAIFVFSPGVPLGTARGEEPEKTKPAQGSVQSALKNLRLPDLDGQMVDLGASLGKGPLLIDFWATWCKPCQAALPRLSKLYVDLHPRGLQMFGINEDTPRSVSQVKPFIKSHGFQFPVVLDLNHDAQTRLNVIGMPATLLVDSSGKVVYTLFVYTPGETEKLREQIEPLLGGKPEEKRHE